LRNLFVEEIHIISKLRVRLKSNRKKNEDNGLKGFKTLTLYFKSMFTARDRCCKKEGGGGGKE